MGKLRQVYNRCAHDVDTFVQAKVLSLLSLKGAANTLKISVPC